MSKLPPAFGQSGCTHTCCYVIETCSGLDEQHGVLPMHWLVHSLMCCTESEFSCKQNKCCQLCGFAGSRFFRGKLSLKKRRNILQVKEKENLFQFFYGWTTLFRYFRNERHFSGFLWIKTFSACFLRIEDLRQVLHGLKIIFKSYIIGTSVDRRTSQVFYGQKDFQRSSIDRIPPTGLQLRKNTNLRLSIG